MVLASIIWLLADTLFSGVIPRAVDVLFQKLQGPPALRRSDSSNLRAPTRYSMTSPHSSSQNVMTMAKLASERNWQMKATYVEVGFMLFRRPITDTNRRSTMNNYATFYCQSLYPIAREQQWQFGKTPRVEYF